MNLEDISLQAETASASDWDSEFDEVGCRAYLEFVPSEGRWMLGVESQEGYTAAWISEDDLQTLMGLLEMTCTKSA